MTDVLSAKLDEMLPCPFCGGEASYHTDTEEDDFAEEWMACADCGASTTIETWNRRTPSQALSLPITAEPGEVVAYRGRYEHPGEDPDEWHLFHGKPANGHADWRSYPLYARPQGMEVKVINDIVAAADRWNEKQDQEAFSALSAAIDAARTLTGKE